jgi:preprotein translocase subunit YajC
METVASDAAKKKRAHASKNCKGGQRGRQQKKNHFRVGDRIVAVAGHRTDSTPPVEVSAGLLATVADVDENGGDMTIQIEGSTNTDTISKPKVGLWARKRKQKRAAHAMDD